MTPQRAKELLPVIHAFAEGKKIEIKISGSNKWDIVEYPAWNDDNDYRIRPTTREISRSRRRWKRLFCE